MSDTPSGFRRLLARIQETFGAKPKASSTLQILLTRLESPLSDTELDAAVARPFAGLTLPDSDAITADERESLLDLAADALLLLTDPFQAARLACYCGTLVEEGAPAARVTTALAELLDRHNQVLCSFLDEVGDATRAVEPFRARYPHVYRTWLGARLVNMAVMTAFCRDLDGRVAARSRPEFVARINRVGSRVLNGYYVETLFACTDRLRLAVIHPAQGRGFVVNANAIRDNYHLWILLEAMLLGEGRFHDTVRKGATKRASLRFFHPYAWRNWPLSLTTDAGRVAGGESPSKLACVADELPVLLVAPNREDMRWSSASSASLHDAYRPEVSVERELSWAEVNECLQRCAESSPTLA